jgi:magnesium chelatase subunit D
VSISGRALRFAALTAGASARLAGRDVVLESDLAAAARLVLAPRATRLPPPPPQDEDEARRPSPPPPRANPTPPATRSARTPARLIPTS